MQCKPVLDFLSSAFRLKVARERERVGLFSALSRAFQN
jgi:hypothetical protein